MFKNSRSQSVCALCFNEITATLGFIESLVYTRSVCLPCHTQMAPRCTKIDFGGFCVYALHPYSQFMKEIIVRYKDFGDIYLAKVFLESVGFGFRFLYKDYVVVCVPSSIGSVAKRGFDHTEIIAHQLNQTIISNVIENRSIKKQKTKTKHERTQIADFMYLLDASMITGKKVIVFDDVMASGSSMKACLDLLEPYASGLVGLVVAYVPPKGD